jgi:adenylate cyclase
LGAVAVLLGAVLVMEGGFWVMRLIPSWSGVLIAAGSSTLLMGLQRLQQEEELKRQLRQNFSLYVPPKLVEMLVQNPDKAQEQGTRQRVAILFSDVRNFTTYSEQHEPEIVVRQMREYLDDMTVSVDNADGILDKYIGDAVMALYGPFLPEGDNVSARAVLSGLDMLDRLEAINAGWREEGLSEFRIGIGIHTGPAIVGNIGTPRRTQFTALGDTVNLAARLESSTKELKASILVSEPVKDEAEAVLGKVAEFIDRGSITVKGREQAVRVYEVRRRQPGTDEEASYARDEEERLQPA